MKVYPEPASKECIEEILIQMKNSIYKIYTKDEKSELGIGFFCHIKYEDMNIPVVIINKYKLIKEDVNAIKIFKESDKREIKLKNTRIKNREFNITLIEIQENKKDEIHFWK